VITLANASLLTPGASSPQVTVRVTDQGGLTFDKVLTLSVLPAVITGTSGNDTLTGGSTYTTLIGLGGNDRLVAGSGGAAAAYTGAPAGVVVNLAAGTAQDGYGGTDTLVGINNATGSSFADTLTGNSSANTLDGGGGADTLAGGAGNDTYVFGRGYGFGNVFDDVQQVSTNTTTSSTVIYTYTPVYGTTAKGGPSGAIDHYDTTSQVSTYNVTTTVTTHVDGGSDTLSFKAGISVADVMMQASGNNLVVGIANPANPSATFAQLTDKVTLLSWFDALDRIETFSFADGTTINVSGMAFQAGGSGSNTLTGTAASNWLNAGPGGGTLTGGSGVDVLIGGAGATTLIGAGGNDRLYGGSGATVASYAAATNPVAVNLAAGTAQDGYGGTDTLVNIHAVVAGNNATLTAGSGTDTLTVTGSNGTLVAGSGTSTLVDSGSGGFYKFGPGATRTTIVNGAAGNASASNELDFITGISNNQLWFLQSGNDLKIDVLGTTNQVTVSNWFGATGNRLAEITAGSVKLDSQVAQLVQAMATYSASHAGFDPTTATQMPTDAALQSTIASSWHA